MKFAKFFVMTIAAGAFVGWLAPGESDPDAGTGSDGRTEEAARIEVAQTAAWNSGEVVLPRSYDGHFYADVTVDGASAHMLVDTGASMVALTGEDADTLGIDWDPQDVEPVARGASGPVFGVRTTIDRIELGEFEARSVDAVVVPEGLDISLLGQSFLSQVPRVEMEPDRMVLGG